MIPFLILSMVDIILSGTVGIVVVVALFHIHIVHGVVSLAVYLVSICQNTGAFNEALLKFHNHSSLRGDSPSGKCL